MSDLADEYDTGISNPGAGGASDGVFMTSLRTSDGEPPISSSEPTMHNTTAAAAKVRRRAGRGLAHPHPRSPTNVTVAWKGETSCTSSIEFLMSLS